MVSFPLTEAIRRAVSISKMRSPGPGAAMQPTAVEDPSQSGGKMDRECLYLPMDSAKK